MADWTRLPDGQNEQCASVSCGHSPAAWRMDAGGIGSYYCETCRSKIVGPLAEMEPCGCPTPGACSAVERIAKLEAALRNARAQLITLGGEALHVHGDGIQRAVLNEIDAALKHSS